MYTSFFASLFSLLLVQTLPAPQTRAGLMPVKVLDGGKQERVLYQESHALLIGASQYGKGWTKLPGVKRDMEALQAALLAQDFHVVLVEDPNKMQLVQAVEQFIKNYGRQAENRLLIYFSGHGHTLEQSYGGKMGYIVPVDAPDPSRDHNGFLDHALDMSMIEVYAKQIQAKHAMFLFDSCFSGSFFALSRAASTPAAINYKTSEPVRQIITAGEAEEEVPDESLFCRELIKGIQGEADKNQDGYVTGNELGEFLQTAVVNYSRNAQHPQFGKLRDPRLDKGDFVFVVKSNQPPRDNNPPPPPKIEKLYGSLEFVTSAGGLLTIKGEAYQNEIRLGSFQRVSLEKIPAGYYEIRLESEGYEPISEREILVRPDILVKRTYEQKKKDLLPGTRRTLQIAGVEFAFRWIPPGEFMMGSPASEDDRDADETRHRVVLSQGFWLLEIEVTQAMWQAVMGNNPSEFKGDNRPVENVSHDEVQGFLQKLKAMTGADYRLPSEAEWEYACRAGTSTSFHYGKRMDVSMANFNGINLDDGYTKGIYRGETTDVKSFQPNAWGLYDMHGNVWEWCADWYGAYEKLNENPIGPSQGTFRVLRGGGWSSLGWLCRSADRSGIAPGDRDTYYGFRLATSNLGK